MTALGDRMRKGKHGKDTDQDTLSCVKIGEAEHGDVYRILMDQDIEKDTGGEGEPSMDIDHSAVAFCEKAASLLQERARDRDTPTGERSMYRCVAAFNSMTGHALSVEEGWLFMVYLKHSRMRAGAFNLDHHEDAVAYQALMAEEASWRI